MKPYQLVLFFILASCSERKEDICLKINKGIRQGIEDTAFKNNLKLKIYDLNTVDFKVVSESERDSFELESLSKRIAFYHDKYMELAELISSQLTQVELLSSLEMYKLKEMKKSEIQKSIKRLDSIKDTLNMYRIQDSLITRKIIKKDNVKKKFYLSKTFTKLTINGTNQLDTVNYILTDKFKLIIFK